MMARKSLAVAAAFGAAAVFVTTAQVRAGGDKVAFPKDYATGVMYASHDLVPHVIESDAVF